LLLYSNPITDSIATTWRFEST